MQVSADVRAALRKELTRLEKERAEIDKTLAHVRGMLKASGDSTQTARKPRAAGKAKTAGRKPGKRQKQALSLIEKNPGITGSELAKQLNLKHATSIYPVLKSLTERGEIAKSGKGYKKK